MHPTSPFASFQRTKTSHTTRDDRFKPMCTAMLLLVCALLSLGTCHGLAFEAKKPKKSIRIHATKSVAQPVTVPSSGSHLLLHNYMQLPAAQYTCVPMPLNSSLTRVEGSTCDFILEVPKMKFHVPGVDAVHVIPQVFATVLVSSNRVDIMSNACKIRGSPIIEKLKINEQFSFACKSCLTWKDPTTSKLLQDNAMAIDKKNDDTIQDTAQQEDHVIYITTEINVDFYPPGIFAKLPHGLQRGVGNVAMYITLHSLLNKFMRSLGKDYERWSTDSNYRMQRQEMEEDLEREMEKQETKKQKRILFW